MKILHLTIKKQWFDMILSGEKKEEYRELKEFWKRRLRTKQTYLLQNFDAIKFYNGWACSEKYPNFLIECKGIQIREGKKEWGAEPGTHYFVLQIGNIISKQNVQ